MPLTVTCQCGQRITVGPQPDRQTLDCPSCGETVSLNGATQPAGLTFGVQFVDESNAAHAPPEAGQIDFLCPGCDKQFRESHHAAGKRTRCPRCETEFVISPARPAADSPPDPNVDSQAKTPESGSKDPVDAAVAAYGAAKQRRRLITPGSMVPIGFALIMLGGLVSMLGSYLMVKSIHASISNLGLGGSLDGGASDDVLRQAIGRIDQINEFAREPDLQPRRNRPRIDPGKLPLGGNGSGKSPKEQHSGQAMLIGGVIASGIGMLMTFIGGIFLLAGLIGRFLQPAMLPG